VCVASLKEFLSPLDAYWKPRSSCNSPIDGNLDRARDGLWDLLVTRLDICAVDIARPGMSAWDRGVVAWRIVFS